MCFLERHVCDFLPKEKISTCVRPNPGAARGAPRTSREPGPHFRIRLYTGKYNKENALPVPVFGKNTRELSGHTEENPFCVCDFTSENKEEKNHRHLNPNCRPFLRFVYARYHQKNRRISLVFTGISRVLIPNTFTVLEKIVLGWRLACILFSIIPKTLYPGSRLMVACLVYAGVGA